MFSYLQRENIEMYLKACANYGLKEQDLFQVNDLYENKNLYMVVDNLYNLGGMVREISGPHKNLYNPYEKNLHFRLKRKAGMDQFWA